MCWLDLKLIFLTLALVLCALEVNGNECPDPSVVYRPAGASYSCAKCQKGQRVVEDCKQDNLQSTECEDCPPKQFQNCLSGSKQCYDCKTSCEQNQVMARECSKTANLQCKCKVDHAARRQGVELLCQPCTRPTVVKDTGGGDQGCSPCPLNHYYFKNESLPDVPARCLPCTECAEVESPCLKDQDAKCKEISGGTNGHNPLGIGLGVGFALVLLIVLVIVIVCIIKRRRKRREQEPQGGGSSNTNGSTVPLNDVRDCSDVPEIQEDDFLITKTFTWLAKNLGKEWTMFMRDLPGREFHEQVDVIMDQSKMNHHAVSSEQIVATLRQWKNLCDEEVNTANIVETLHKAKTFRHSTSQPDIQEADRYVREYKRALQEWAKSSSRVPGAQANGPGASNLPSSDVSGSGDATSNPGPEAGDPKGGVDHPDRSPPGPLPPGRLPSGRLPPGPSSIGPSSRGPLSPGPSPPGPSSTNSSAHPSARPRPNMMFGGGEDVTDGNRRGNPPVHNAVNPPQLELGPPPRKALAESLSDPSPLDEEGTGLLDSAV